MSLPISGIIPARDYLRNRRWQHTPPKQTETGRVRQRAYVRWFVTALRFDPQPDSTGGRSPAAQDRHRSSSLWPVRTPDGYQDAPD